MIKLKKILYEGTWGSGPLDNDSASDWKWEIGDILIDEIQNKLETKNFDNKYHAIGMWQFLKINLETNYSFFTEDEIKKMDLLVSETANQLLDNPDKLINLYKNPKEVEKYLKSVL